MGRKPLVFLIAILLMAQHLFGGPAAALRTIPAPVDAMKASAILPMARGDGRFGICFIDPSEPWLSLAYNAGARINRWQLNWRDIEPQEGNFYYGWYDPQIKAMRAKGFEVSAILIYPPDWAVEGDSSVPLNLYLPFDAPDNYWGRFVRKVVSHYKDKIKYWEVWNEPDLGDTYWDGTERDYYQLLKVAYQAAKAADPSCQIIMGGMSHWTNPRFFEGVLRLATEDQTTAANNHYFDIVAWHWYSRSSLLYDKVLWCRQVLAKYGLEKPIWVNETNVPLWGDWPGPSEPRPGHATPDEAASFIIQAYANALAAGAERVFVFRLRDEFMGEAYGLVRNDGTPRPSYEAYKVAATFLSNVITATREVSGSLTAVTLEKSPRGRVTVLWNDSPDPITATLRATTPVALLVDKAGNIARRRPINGFQAIHLPGATNDGLIGGSPYLLVEADNAPPSSEVSPLPAMMESLTFTVRWRGNDDPLGLGLADYDVQYRDGLYGPWTDWLTKTTATAALFTGLDGHTYYFRSRARDLMTNCLPEGGEEHLVREGGETACQMGNVEPYPDEPDAVAALVGSLTGEVLDVRDVHAGGATICLDAPFGPCTTADGLGHFQMTDILSGTHAVAASKDGLGSLSSKIRVVRGQESAYVLRLPPGDDLIANGDFERRWSPWMARESYCAAVVEDGDGGHHLRLGCGRGEAGLSYSVHIAPTMRQPTLAFDYKLVNPGDMFSVRVWEEGSPSGCVTLLATREGAEWRHLWFDLSPYRGRRLRIEFSLQAFPPRMEFRPKLTKVYIDNLSVGSVSSMRFYFPWILQGKAN